MPIKLPAKSSATIIIENQNIEDGRNIVLDLLNELFSYIHNPQLKKTKNTIKDFLKCPDFYYISSASVDKNSIPIENIREIISKLQFSAIQNPKRCLFIENGKDLSIESQNTLLKTLEEPPENTYIIISVEDKNYLLSTVRSRCLIYSSNTKNSSEEKYLLPEDLESAFNEVEKISKISDLKRKRDKAYLFFDALIEKANILPVNRRYASLKKLLYFRNAISKNANLRLVLENGIIEIYS